MATVNHLALFDTVLLNYSTLIKSGVGQGYDFQITCVLRAGSDVTLGNGKQAHGAPQEKGGGVQ